MLKQLCLLFLLINFGVINAHGGHKTLGSKAGRNAGTIYYPGVDWQTDRALQNLQRKKMKTYEKNKRAQAKPADCADFCYAACAIVTITAWAALGTWLNINSQIKA